jgi:Ca2+-binding RTX toxin-like protein
MRKMVLLVAMLAMVLATAAVAYGAVRNGNGNDNYLGETCGADTLRGYGGEDTLDANNCGDDEDVLRGGKGYDRLLANDNDRLDNVNGGLGYDLCVVDARVELAGGCNDIRIR